MLRLLAPLKAAAAPAVPLIDVFLVFGIVAARACTNMSTHASQTQAGTHRHVGLSARACTSTSTHASQTQARTQHKPPFWRLPGRLRVLSSASLGGSIFCSWTCPEQGSHIVVLDGSLFEKEQGGHTFGHGPHVRRVHPKKTWVL